MFGLKPELDIFSYDILAPSFRDFSRLPPELRAKVWQYTFPGTPRTFYLAADPITFELQIRTFSQLPRDLAITLQINQESRGETFRAYDTCIPYAHSSWYHHRTAYVNFNVDIFWFEGCEESINVPTISSDPSADLMGPDTVISYDGSRKSFIDVASGEKYNKIQCLIVNMSLIRRQFVGRGMNPPPAFGLPAKVKELLCVSAWSGFRLKQKGVALGFKEDDKERPKEAETDSDINRHGHGRHLWWERHDLHTAILEDAQQACPEWNAPLLKFESDIRKEVEPLPTEKIPHVKGPRGGTRNPNRSKYDHSESSRENYIDEDNYEDERSDEDGRNYTDEDYHEAERSDGGDEEVGSWTVPKVVAKAKPKSTASGIQVSNFYSILEVEGVEEEEEEEEEEEGW